jgi:hypothetical protein
MIQRGGSLGFTLEAAKGLRVFGDLVRKELESHEAAEFHVLGFVNDAHPAAAQLLDDAVVRYGLADHYEIPRLQVDSSYGWGFCQSTMTVLA